MTPKVARSNDILTSLMPFLATGLSGLDTSNMSPRSFPAEPHFADQSERAVWQELERQLPDNAVMIANLALRDDNIELEIDLIVAWPNVGVAILEVKGGKIRPNADSTFEQGDANGWHTVDPLAQVMRNSHGLKNYLKRHWSRRDLSAKQLIVFPYGDIKSAYERPDLPRNIIIDEVDLATIADRIKTVLMSHTYRPDQTEVDLLVQHLAGKSVTQKSLLDDKAERAQRLIVLTDEQLKVLEMLKLSKSFAVLGAAGCGKTYVAIEQARQRAMQGDRVLFLCYNRGLASFVKKRFATMPENERPIFITTLHALGPRWGHSIDQDRAGTNEYWEIELPTALMQLAEHLAPEEKFDTVIIDEAQDFHPLWWQVVSSALKDHTTGRTYAFGDLHQGVFRKDPNIPLELCPIVLSKNVRNAQPIAELAAICLQDAPEIAGLEGPPVRLIECNDQTAEDVANRQVAELIDKGWLPSDICVLTTGDSHAVKRERERTLGPGGYWESFYTANEVFYGHVLGFKGLERSAIVLAINGWKHPDHKRDMLYAGITRARDLLIICGDKETLKHGGGKELVKKLSHPELEPSE